jgi:hypothetical protein
MGMLLAFAPFVVFVTLEHAIGPAFSLAAGTMMSALLLLRDLLRPERQPKFLEIGTFLLFGGLTLFMAASGIEASVLGVRVCVDSGLLLIVLLSLAMGHPFTLQYAREKVHPSFWHSPHFLRTNYIISGAWALAFLVMVSIEWAMLLVPALPHRLGIVVIVLALLGALRFTRWYPARLRLPFH